MYAVIKTGGKQYRVAKGDVVKVEKLAGAAGATIELDQVLAVGDESGLTVGTPLLADARVTAEVLEQARAPKILVFKRKRRKRYRRRLGHRQELTVLRITEIAGSGAEPKAAAKKTAAGAKETAAEDKKPAKKAPARKAAAKKEPAKKAAEDKAPAKKAPAKKAPAKKTAAKKTAAKKAADKTGEAG